MRATTNQAADAFPALSSAWAAPTAITVSTVLLDTITITRSADDFAHHHTIQLLWIVATYALLASKDAKDAKVTSFARNVKKIMLSSITPALKINLPHATMTVSSWRLNHASPTASNARKEYAISVLLASTSTRESVWLSVGLINLKLTHPSTATTRKTVKTLEIVRTLGIIVMVNQVPVKQVIVHGNLLRAWTIVTAFAPNANISSQSCFHWVMTGLAFIIAHSSTLPLVLAALGALRIVGGVLPPSNA